MAPIEARFNNSWSEEADVVLEAGEVKRINRDGIFLQVRCNRVDQGGQVFLRDETTQLKTPDRGHGIEIPFPETAHAVAKINIPADSKSPVELRIHGEVIGAARFIR